MKKLALGLSVAAVVVAVFVGSASALTSPPGVGLAGCIFGSGNATTPAGQDVQLHFGDIEANRGIAQLATKNWTFAAATIDGVLIANPSSYWNAPVPDSDFVYNGVLYPNVWDAWWTYDTGVTLSAGETMTVYLDVAAQHPQPDSFIHGAPAPGPYPQTVMDGSCTITGV